MNIKVYAICWNEEVFAPYFLKHYKSITKDIVIYDNCSDDKTCEILAECEIRKYDTKGKIRDDIYLEIKNSVWKECKGEYDWVIICDMDELVYCNNLRLALEKAKENGFTAIQPTGYSMIGDQLPTTKGMIYEEINQGVKDDNYSKCCIINPNLITETNYKAGCHSHKLEGEVKIWKTNDVKVLHYNFLSLDYTIERYGKYKERLSDINIKNNWGIHYNFKKEQISKEYNDFKLESSNIINPKKTNISRKRDEINRDELKSLERDNERKIIQDEIDHKKLLIEKNIELKNLIQKKYKTLEDGTIRKVELEIKFLELDKRITCLKDYLKNYLFTFEYGFMDRLKKHTEKKK